MHTPLLALASAAVVASATATTPAKVQFPNARKIMKAAMKEQAKTVKNIPVPSVKSSDITEELNIESTTKDLDSTVAIESHDEPKYLEISYGFSCTDTHVFTHAYHIGVCMDKIDEDEGLGGGVPRSMRFAHRSGSLYMQHFFVHQCKGTPVVSQELSLEQFGFPNTYNAGDCQDFAGYYGRASFQYGRHIPDYSYVQYGAAHKDRFCELPNFRLFESVTERIVPNFCYDEEGEVEGTTDYYNYDLLNCGTTANNFKKIYYNDGACTSPTGEVEWLTPQSCLFDMEYFKDGYEEEQSGELSYAFQNCSLTDSDRAYYQNLNNIS